MVYCCVPFCRSQKGKSRGISVHEFPSDIKMRLKWIEAMMAAFPETGEEASEWHASQYNVVCSLHFATEAYRPGCKIKILKSDSVPTIFHKDVSVSRQSRKKVALDRDNQPVAVDRFKSEEISNDFQPDAVIQVENEEISSDFQPVAVTQVENEEISNDFQPDAVIPVENEEILNDFRRSNEVRDFLDTQSSADSISNLQKRTVLNLKSEKQLQTVTDKVHKKIDESTIHSTVPYNLFSFSQVSGTSRPGTLLQTPILIKDEIVISDDEL